MSVTAREDEIESLWARFIGGNDVACKELYNFFVQPLFRYGCHFSKDESLVKDCIQDLFVDMLSYRSKLSMIKNVQVYLFISLKRKIFKRMKRDMRMGTIGIENIPFEYAFSEVNNGDKENYDARITDLRNAMEQLSNRQREAIYLRFVACLEYNELCNILQLNYQAARNLVHRSLEKLRESHK